MIKNPTSDKSGNLTLPYAFIQASFWMSFCTAVSFASVYLLGLSYTNTELGLILALGNLLGALFGPELSALVDRSEKISASLLIPPVLSLQAVFLLILIVHPLKSGITSVAYTLYIAFTLTANSLNLKLYSDAVYHGLSINYGFARGIGSAAYVLLSMFLGILIERISVRLVPVSGLLMCVTQFAAFFLIWQKLPASAPSTDVSRKASSILGFFRGNRRFSLLLLGVALLFSSHNIPCIETQAPYTEETANKLKNLLPEALVMLGGFGIVKEPLLSLVPKGILSYHHGDMRKYRGQPVGFWELYHGEKEMGVTVQRLAAGLDRGTPIVEMAVPIEKGDSVATLRSRALDSSTGMMHEALRLVQQPDFKPAVINHYGPVFTIPNLRQYLTLQIKLLLRK